MENKKIKTGFFAIVGKPNAGKSSLLNYIIGQKVSIVSYKPQTTRNKITGIYTDDHVQFVFLDTPGFLQPDNMLTSFMAKEINSAIEGVDGLIFVVDGSKAISLKEIESIKELSKHAPIVVAINKTDIINYTEVYPIIQKLNELNCIKNIIAISAKTGENIELLKSACADLCTDDIKYYDDSQVTDRTERFMVSEIIREKILLYFQKEIPHGIGVSIDKFVDEPKSVKIDASIICIKQSHKPILVGKSGSGIKKIGTTARVDIEELLEKKVMLNLFVKVRENWKENHNYMSDIGYDKSES